MRPYSPLTFAMPRKRLTREESREQTRQALLDAGAVVIAKRGFAATTVEDIAEHAGYTRGAFYSNFKSKLEVFIELLKTDHVGIQKDLEQLLDADIPIENLQKSLTSLYSQCYHDQNSFLLWMEARQHAMRDAKFRQRLNELTLEKRDVIAYFIQAFCKRMDINPPMSPNVLALAMMALIDGSLYFNMNMPQQMSDESLHTVLGTFFSATFFGNASIAIV
jgi:AcrR family transcriptional regulator